MKLASSTSGVVKKVIESIDIARMCLCSIFVDDIKTNLITFKITQANVGMSVKAASLPADVVSAPLPTSGTEVVFAMTTESFATAMECLPNLEMSDAPPLEVATCMATPVIPDDGGPGAEVRQRVGALGAQAEAQLRLRYAEEITARAAVRLTRLRSRKRSLDDLDLHEVVVIDDDQSSGVAHRNGGRTSLGADGERNESKDDRANNAPSQPKFSSPSRERGNVLPFRHASGKASNATKPSKCV
jgi:hypothetical protein